MPHIITVLILIITSAISGCGNSHLYYDQAVSATKSIQDILIENNICKNRPDCSKKELVFFESGSGVFITVYAANQESVIKEIRNAICAIHDKEPGIVHSIKINSTRHGDTNQNTEFKLTLRSDEKCQ